MSETTTVKVPAKGTVTKAFAPFVEKLSSIGAAIVKKGHELALLKVDLGYQCRAASVALTTIGVPAEDVQTRLLAAIPGDLSWDTVEGYMRASSVDEGLPEEHRRLFGSDALRAIAGVKEGEDRNAFVAQLVADGVTAIRPIRDRVSDTKESSGNGSQSPANAAGGLVKKFKKFGEDGRATILQNIGGQELWTPGIQEALNAAMEVGIAIGRGSKGTKPMVAAGEILVYCGPVEADDQS